jgi:hypothetical protein
MEDSRIMGIYLYKTKKFYFIEGNATQSQTDIDKLRTTLLARDLITIAESGTTANQYQIKSLAHAKLENWDIEVIHLNNHTKKFSSPDKTKTSKDIDIWD